MKLCGGVLPNLAEQYAVGFFRLYRHAQIVYKAVGQLVGNVKPPAGRAEPQPFPYNSVFAADKFVVVGALLGNLRKRFKAPPALIFVGVAVKFIPLEIRRRF